MNPTWPGVLKKSLSDRLSVVIKACLTGVLKDRNDKRCV